MTVNELIAILSELDGHIRVLVEGYEDGFHDLIAENVEQVAFFEGVSNKSYRGPHEPDSEGDKVGLLLGRGAFT